MVKKWDRIYELRADAERVRLFGSDDWWVAIDNGSIERRTLEGTITEAHPTEFGLQPEFRMLMDDGAELTGARHGDETRYAEGLRLRMEYVTVEHERDAAAELGPTAEVVLPSVDRAQSPADAAPASLVPCVTTRPDLDAEGLFYVLKKWQSSRTCCSKISSGTVSSTHGFKGVFGHGSSR